MTVRRLEEPDIPSIFHLFSTAPLNWTRAEPIKDAEDLKARMASGEYEFIGAYNEANELTMAICGRRWRSQPAFSLVNLKSTSKPLFSDFKNLFPQLVQLLLKVMEAEGRFEFWYLIEDKKIYHSRAERRGQNILQHLVPELSDYLFFNVVRIPAQTLPDWPLYQSFLGYTPARTDTVIKRVIHKRMVETV